MVIIKSYFTKRSRIWTVCQSLSKIELSATEVKGFQCKASATNSSILDITGVPDLPLITAFAKVIFNLTQATVISFILIAIDRRSYIYAYETIFYQRRIYTPASVCATRVNDFQCKLLPQRAPSQKLQALWISFWGQCQKKYNFHLAVFNLIQ